MAIVLMVEDEEQIRVLAESVLQEAGHKVLTATGIEGAKALLDSDQRIDVLFLDLNLGGDPEAGLLVAQRAQAMRPKLSYLYTTGAGVNEGSWVKKPSLRWRVVHERRADIPNPPHARLCGKAPGNGGFLSFETPKGPWSVPADAEFGGRSPEDR
jgi:CheY-like chemotaxis protein